jgi:hypothetical protein
LIIWSGFNSVTNRLGIPFLLAEVSFYLFTMIEVISNSGVYILDSKRRKTDGDLFRRRSLLILVNDRVQAYARAGDPDGPVVGKRQR